jgi:hypothetical protein
MILGCNLVAKEFSVAWLSHGGAFCGVHPQWAFVATCKYKINTSVQVADHTYTMEITILVWFLFSLLEKLVSSSKLIYIFDVVGI